MLQRAKSCHRFASALLEDGLLGGARAPCEREPSREAVSSVKSGAAGARQTARLLSDAIADFGPAVPGSPASNPTDTSITTFPTSGLSSSARPCQSRLHIPHGNS